MSKIEWTEKTWNPITGCSDASTGCKNCYARGMSHRLASMSATSKKYRGLTAKHNGRLKWTGRIRVHPEELSSKVLRGKPKMIFVNSMSDTFHPKVPAYFIHQMFYVMRSHPQHTFQVLTKRPERIREVFRSDLKSGSPFPDNIWLGTSAENQKTYNKRVKHIFDLPAKVKFLSCEPLLDEIDLKFDEYGQHPEYDCGINWVIVGGESGHGARIMKSEWAESIRDQCREFNIPFFFKQWGTFNEFGEKVGKSHSGRMLDGRRWDEMPLVN